MQVFAALTKKTAADPLERSGAGELDIGVASLCAGDCDLARGCGRRCRRPLLTQLLNRYGC